jgi:NAD(P)H-dependent FMN reductase
VTSTPPRIAIIVASTRTVRFADHPLAWLTTQLAKRRDIEYFVIDVRDHQLPYYDLPVPPAMAPRKYTSDAERELGEKIDSADGYLIITNEFNHGYSAALKNVLDHYSVEFRRKVVAFMGYGNVGGSRAIEQLRQVAVELDMASVKPTVHVFGTQMAAVRQGGEGEAAIFAAIEPRLELMLDDLAWWATALREARAKDALEEDDAA